MLQLAWQFRGKSSELLELFYPEGFTAIRSHNTADTSSLQYYFLRKLQVFWDMTPCGLVNIYIHLLMSSSVPSSVSKQSEMIELFGP